MTTEKKSKTSLESIVREIKQRNRRKYPRALANIRIRFRQEKHSKESCRYLSGVTENCSLGGMFITSTKVLPKGSIISMEFDIVSAEEKTSRVQARAIVRWNKRFGSQKGMGVEFIEFSGLENKAFAEWINHMVEKAQ